MLRCCHYMPFGVVFSERASGCWSVAKSVIQFCEPVPSYQFLSRLTTQSQIYFYYWDLFYEMISISTEPVCLCEKSVSWVHSVQLVITLIYCGSRRMVDARIRGKLYIWCWHNDIEALYYWPFVRRIHRSPVDSPHNGPLMLSFDVFLAVGLQKLFDRLPSCQWS